MTTSLHQRIGEVTERIARRSQDSRRRYLDGAPKRPVAEEAADTRALFKAIAEIGGADLVGGATDLDAAAFYDPAK